MQDHDNIISSKIVGRVAQVTRTLYGSRYGSAMKT